MHSASNFPHSLFPPVLAGTLPPAHPLPPPCMGRRGDQFCTAPAELALQEGAPWARGLFLFALRCSSTLLGQLAGSLNQQLGTTSVPPAPRLNASWLLPPQGSRPLMKSAGATSSWGHSVRTSYEACVRGYKRSIKHSTQPLFAPKLSDG